MPTRADYYGASGAAVPRPSTPAGRSSSSNNSNMMAGGLVVVGDDGAGAGEDGGGTGTHSPRQQQPSPLGTGPSTPRPLSSIHVATPDDLELVSESREKLTYGGRRVFMYVCM
jgi:hypothetical protein